MKTISSIPRILTMKSSAGSGKTYRLALQYLLLLAGAADNIPRSPNSMRNIVAITFTNKAVSEMRERIIDWMKRIVLDLPFDESESKPIEAILKEFATITGRGRNGNGLPPREQITARIGESFERILTHFYDFKVSTIDSFVNLTLKASAFTLGLPPDFEITTETSSQTDYVLQECLQDILEDKDTRGTFDRFIDLYLNLEGIRAGWVPKTFIRNLIRSFWYEEAKDNLIFAPAMETGSLESKRRHTSVLIAKLLGEIRSKPQIRLDARFMSAMEKAAGKGEFESNLSAYFKRPSLANCMNKGSAEPPDSLETLWHGVRNAVRDCIETYALLRFASYVDVYELFKKKLDLEVKRIRRLVLIEELNALLQNVIGRENFIPEIYYALSEQYLHFLVDEFQDTNHLQWKNIEVLVTEALSRGGTLFLVGDKKQAIYRWRGGKAELVDAVSENFRNFFPESQSLDTNYRSGEQIVRFNNNLFAPENLGRLVDDLLGVAMEEEKNAILDTYDGSFQRFTETRAGGGYVRVEKIGPEEDEEGEAQRFTKSDTDTLLKEKVAALIVELRSRGTYRDNDIAILTRRNSETRLVVRMLLEMGLPVDSELTISVKHNPLVRELVSFLRFVESPQDDLSFSSFITGEIFRRSSNLPHSLLFDWIVRRRTVASTVPLSIAFHEDFPDLYQFFLLPFLHYAGYIPLYDFIHFFLRSFDVFKKFSADTPYFLHLLELVNERQGLGENSIQGFLSFWDMEGASQDGDRGETEKAFLIKSAESSRGIRVMTVHKAKGLQFPVVILPFLKITDFRSADGGDKTKFFLQDGDTLRLLYIKNEYTEFSDLLASVYRQRELEHVLDELNITYVACTRAKEELYLLLAGPKKKNRLASYCFSMNIPGLAGDGKSIEIGQKRGAKLLQQQEKIPEPESAPPCIHIETAGLPWAERDKNKFIHPSLLSKRSIEASRMGDVVHYILSLIEWLPSAGERQFLDERIRSGIARFRFSEYGEEVKQLFSRFFAKEGFRQFFIFSEGKTVHTEKEITDSEGNLLRVDRIVVGEKTVDVIDFKTGEEKSPDHKSQVQRYRKLVSALHPGKTVRSYLLYIDDEEVLPV